MRTLPARSARNVAVVLTEATATTTTPKPPKPEKAEKPSAVADVFAHDGGPALLGIPTRTQAVEAILPKNAPDVDQRLARSIAKTLASSITQQLNSGTVQVEASWSVSDQGTTGAWSRSLSAEEKHTIDSLDANPRTLDAALRPVIEELVNNGYYNIVFMVAPLERCGKTSYHDNGKRWPHQAYTTSHESWHEASIQIQFSVSGPKRFDVDFETAARLASLVRGDESAWGVWRNYQQGQLAILDNSNGMDAR